ncbi:unnamed protein product [Urochloa humidicola]
MLFYSLDSCLTNPIYFSRLTMHLGDFTSQGALMLSTDVAAPSLVRRRSHPWCAVPGGLGVGLPTKTARRAGDQASCLLLKLLHRLHELADSAWALGARARRLDYHARRCCWRALEGPAGATATISGSDYQQSTEQALNQFLGRQMVVYWQASGTFSPLQPHHAGTCLCSVGYAERVTEHSSVLSHESGGC